MFAYLVSFCLAFTIFRTDLIVEIIIKCNLYNVETMLHCWAFFNVKKLRTENYSLLNDICLMINSSNDQIRFW